MAPAVAKNLSHKSGSTAVGWVKPTKKALGTGGFHPPYDSPSTLPGQASCVLRFLLFKAFGMG